MDLPTNPAENALEGLIGRLHARGRLRVWSLVITVFGDAIAPRGGRVALSVLQELLGRLRVEPGAVRTALSRLASDRWVTRERDGRNSFYRLAEEGRHAFDLATRRIYAAGPPEWDGRWIVAVRPGGGENGMRATRDRAMRKLGFAPIGPAAWLKPHTGGADPLEDLPGDLLAVDGEAIRTPPGIERLWALDELASAYEALSRELAPLADALDAGARLSPLEAMAARTLLIHDWRRIVLRDPGLPAALLPPDWPGEMARAKVKAIHAALDEASETWLDQAGLPGRGKVERFGDIQA